MTPSKRTCSQCGKEKHVKEFYRQHDVCRPCILPAARAESAELATEVERHRQEKEVKRLMKAELRKIARQRINNRKQRAKERLVCPSACQ